MKKLSLFVLLTLSSIKAICQQNIYQANSCNFLKGINFKKGTATVIIKVIYHEIARFDNDMPELNKLAAEGKIMKNNFTAQIGFKTKECSQELSAPCSSINPYILKKHPIGSEILITCKAFEGYKYSPNSDMPFFVITNVEPETRLSKKE